MRPLPDISIRRIVIATTAATPWLAISLLSLMQAEAHRRALLPFGTGSICGGQPHCNWCAVAIVSAVLAMLTAVLVLTASSKFQKIGAR